MPTVILLTSVQADAVRGPSEEASALSALQPIALTDGRFILGVEVLDDLSHADHWELLLSLPTSDYADIADLVPQPVHG